VSEAMRDELAEAVARRVVAMLEIPQPAAVPWLTAEQVAQVLAVDRAYVYEHAAELGGRRLGDGPKARLRFRVEDLEERLPCLSSRGPQPSASAAAKPLKRRRAGQRLGTNAPLLPIRDRRVPS